MCVKEWEKRNQQRGENDKDEEAILAEIYRSRSLRECL